ncbi:MAG: DNA primase, partial [Dehalococcoidales bacterium]|nr:DNA primase [Dehalococcoidales bacterium]
EVVSRYTTLTKAGRNFKALCPFHSEKTPSFFVFPERQSWHCFGACNTGGDAFSFIMKKEGLSFGETLRFLADKVGVLIPTRIEPGPGRDEKERLFQANEVAAQFYHNLLVTSAQAEKVRSYLASRGLNDKSTSDFQLGYSPNTWEALKQYLLERGFTEMEMLTTGLIIQSEDGKTHDRFRNRLIFPICDQRGRVTGFGGRALDNETQPKYLNSPQTPVFDKSDTLYGIHLAAPAIRREDVAVIVEGYMDVIIPHQYGFQNVVASMGIAITEKQVNKLKRLSKNLILALDPDEAGEEAMLRCIEYENNLGAEVRVILLPGGKDPDEVVRENPDSWRGLVKKAMPVIDFAIEKTVGKLNMSTARDKSLAANSLLPIIARVRDDIRRDHYLDKLSKLSGIGYNQLEAVLKNYLNRPKREIQKAKPAANALRSATSAREEYCLTLLLKNPELKTLEVGLLPDYFQDSENREIYVYWLETDDLLALKERLDPIVRDRVNELEARPLSTNRIREKYNDCVLMLRKDYLQSQEAIRKEIFALEAEVGGTGADLARLKQEGIEPSQKLKEVFSQKAQMTRRARK